MACGARTELYAPPGVYAGSDANHCVNAPLPDAGACVNAPLARGTCAVSSPTVLVSQAFPDGYTLLINAGYLYWKSGLAAGNVMRVPVAGGMPETVGPVPAWPANQPFYLVAGRDAAFIDGSLEVTRIQAGSAEVIGMTCSDGILVAESNELLILGTDVASQEQTVTLDVFPYGGSRAARVGSTNIVAGDIMYLSHRCGHVFVSLNHFGQDSGTIVAIDDATVQATVLADAIPCGAAAIAADDTDLYFSSYCEAIVSIVRVPQGGGAAVTIAMAGPSSLQETNPTITLDDTNVYFAALGGVQSVPKAGGPIVSVAQTSPQQGDAIAPWSLVTDGACVYWFSENDPNGAIMAAPVP
jgi:hypothetical protein